jgi:hypothetical protein
MYAEELNFSKTFLVAGLYYFILQEAMTAYSVNETKTVVNLRMFQMLSY